MQAAFYSIVKYVSIGKSNDSRCVNIGVVLEALDNGGIRKLYRFTDNFNGASKLEPRLEPDAVRRMAEASLRQLAWELERPELTLTEILENYCAGRIQLTELQLTIANDLEAKLQDLYRIFVAQ